MQLNWCIGIPCFWKLLLRPLAEYGDSSLGEIENPLDFFHLVNPSTNVGHSEKPSGTLWTFGKCRVRFTLHHFVFQTAS